MNMDVKFETKLNSFFIDDFYSGGVFSMPTSVYKSTAWYREELENIFKPAWHFFCLSHEVECHGDYKTRSFIGENVLVTRGRDGKLKSFINTCRHRGAPLTDKPKGRRKALVCPYHKWAYNLEGELISTPGVENVEKCGLSLVEVSVEEVEGLVFINLNSSEEKAVSLRTFLGDYISSVAKPHNISNMRRVHEKNYTLKSNWKLYVEVDMETLHTPHIHKDSIGKQPVEELSSSGEWIGVFNRSKSTCALKPGLREKGFPYNPGAFGSGLDGTHFCVISPGFFIVTAQDCMWWIQKTPISSTEVEVNIGYCFPKETISRDDFAERSRLYIDRWDQVIKEDDWITEYQQKGLSDRVGSVYTEQESVVKKLDKAIVKKVLGVSDVV